MYAILVLIFLLIAATSNGDRQIGMCIVSALFGLADAICYHNYKSNKNDDKK